MLVIVNYATHYPEAVPLPSLTSAWVAHTLMRFFAQVGLPHVILTDWGSPFTSTLMQTICLLLGIEQLFAEVRQPQT